MRVSPLDPNENRQLHGLVLDRVFTGEDSPMANLMLSDMSAFTEFERSLIRERQREGIA